MPRGRSQLGGRQLGRGSARPMRALGPGPGAHSRSYRQARRVQNSFSGKNSAGVSFTGRRFAHGRFYRASLINSRGARATVLGASFRGRRRSLMISHQGVRRTGRAIKRNSGLALMGVYYGASLGVAASGLVKSQQRRRAVAQRRVGRSELSRRSVRTGVNRTKVTNRGNITSIRRVQTYNKTPSVRFGGMQARRPRKVVTRNRINNRTGRSSSSVRVITGPRVASRYRSAIFNTKSGRGPSQRTMIAGAYAGNSVNPRTRAHYKRVVKSAGYRRAHMASTITRVPTFTQRRVRTRRDSRGRYAGSYAG